MSTVTTATATATAKASPAAAAAVVPASGNALSTLSGNFDNFLNLLMTQLKNQDPTAPMDTNTFTTQLVQFSSVEQQINTNTSLTTLIQATQGGSLLQAAGMVGKTVQATSDHLALQGGKAGVGFTLSAPQQVAVSVANEAGTVLRTGTVSGASGANTWAWDGKDSSGRVLPDGSYRVAVTGVDSSGATQPVPFTVSGTATGVQRSNGALAVQMGAVPVDLSKVQSVGGAP
ncbi:MAG TPA: flagellar hook assembly protein FlgD [Acetobacteraceae bacterium]